MLGRILRTLFSSAMLPGPVDCGGRLSVGMAAYGNSKVTAFALECLFASVRGDFELILVDDNSPDDTLELFRATARGRRNTQIFHFPENKEYGGSLNTVLSHASGACVLFLSNDVLATPSYIRALMDAAANPAHGIVRGVSNFCDDNSTVNNIATPPECGTDRRALFRFAARRHAEQGAAVAAGRFLTGDAFMVQRAVIERIGTIDTRFFGYSSDQDFGVRASAAGFAQVTALGGFAYHLADANFRYLDKAEAEAKARRRRERVTTAWHAFQEKYDDVLPNQDWPNVTHVPWERLNAMPFSRERHYVAPGDYSRFRVA